MVADRLNYGDTIGLVSPSHIADPDRYKHTPIFHMTREDATSYLWKTTKSFVNLMRSVHIYHILSKVALCIMLKGYFLDIIQQHRFR